MIQKSRNLAFGRDDCEEQTLKPNLFSIIYGPTKELAEKVLFGVEDVAQRLKPDSLQSIYVRPNARCGEVGRTLHRVSFAAACVGEGFKHGQQEKKSARNILQSRR